VKPLLRVAGLVKHFPVRSSFFSRGDGMVRAVDGIDFHVSESETLALVGESGCGKSTTARLILRLLEPTAGTIEFDGHDLLSLDPAELRAQRRALQIVFQDPYTSLNPRMTVGQMLAEPLALHRLAPGRHRERVTELLGLVGLAPGYAERYPHEFSGGQRQRIGIARALAAEPKLIVCDEPVSALDVSIQAQVVNLLMDLQREFGLSFVVIAHDLAVVKHIAARVAVMYLGRIVEFATTRALFADPRHPYTQALLSAIPVPEPAARRERLILQGDVPSAIDPPSGCRFRSRCRYAQARCAEEDPALVADAGHATACHFWHDITAPAAALPRATRRPDARVERLQAAFRNPARTI
jgi:oligopeptide transport system ATP-binding protein